MTTRLSALLSSVVALLTPIQVIAGETRAFFVTKKQGMGIGLSIARVIVQAHKGCISAENQTSGGAVFHLSPPLGLS
jgi:K+-sensing histidine kinase KdpD